MVRPPRMRLGSPEQPSFLYCTKGRAPASAQVSRELRLRQEEQPRPIREIAWKAQLRLCAPYRKLARSGKPANIVTAAIARELAGFIWVIARRVPPAAG